LRLDQSVLIVPGEHFGMGRYIRVGYGYDTEALLRGLARIDLTLEELQKNNVRPGLARRLHRSSASGI
jgi:aspartate/methionine/tyrosine aminotransferase